MSMIREELHRLVDRLPEADLRLALRSISSRLEEHEENERDLPFFASFAAEPDLADRHEEILRAESDR